VNTGITSWNTNLLEIGPLYPFVGTEMGLAILAIAAWLIWHFLQARAETQETAKSELECHSADDVLSVLDKQGPET
jgi:hypothetical protein